MTWTLKRSTDQALMSLHNQYHWVDEYGYSALTQSAPVYTLSGAVDIQQGTMLAGRPITLDCTNARIKRSELEQLQAWVQMPELTMTLTHPDGRTFTVLFASPALTDITPVKVIRAGDEHPDDKFTANINLLTV